MKMQLSPAHVEKLRDFLRNNPLEEGEIRRVVGSGEQYITLTGTVVDDEMYTQMYSLSVDGKSHTILAKVSSHSASAG